MSRRSHNFTLVITAALLHLTLTLSPHTDLFVSALENHPNYLSLCVLSRQLRARTSSSSQVLPPLTTCLFLHTSVISRTNNLVNIRGKLYYDINE